MDRFLKNGIREVDFKLSYEKMTSLKDKWHSYQKRTPVYSEQYFKGRGIVMTAGGYKYYTCALISILRLRKIGCKLPIELWYLGNELNDEILCQLRKMGIKCLDFLNINYTFKSYSGFLLKPLAIIYSSFEEVLFLDSDNICINDPEYLFECDEYKSYGCIFWPDYWETSINNPIWTIIDCEYKKSKEQESGQILINKKRCWNALNLCLHFNEENKIYYEFLLGDKDTFRYSWIALNLEFYMVEFEVGSCGYYDKGNIFNGNTMVQFDPNNKVQFLHRNLIKWHATQNDERVWRTIKYYKRGAQKREYIIGYNQVNRHAYVDLDGDYSTLPFVDLKKIEDECIDDLFNLRNSEVYKRFLLFSTFLSRYSLVHSFSYNK